MDKQPTRVSDVPADIIAALDTSADDIRHGRVSDATELLDRAEDRLRSLRQPTWR